MKGIPLRTILSGLRMLILMVALFVIGYTFDAEARQTLESDSLALVAIYNSTNGPNWLPESNWLQGSLDTWIGVYITRGRVDGLHLTNRNLSGSLPPEIGQLTSLWSFDARANDLTGPIPAEFGQIEKIGFIDLSENRLEGAIPEELFGLPNLLEFKARQNNLSGSLPEMDGTAEDLREIDLSENQLSGSIPASISNLSGLENLRLSSNNLSGNLPQEIGDLPILRTFAAAFNQLSGEIPPMLFAAPYLNQLTLNSNQLSGSVHSSIGQAQQLRVLDLRDNPALSGTLPQTMSGMSLMTIFWYSGTNLCDSLDPEFQAWLQGIYDVRGADCVNTTVSDISGHYQTEFRAPYPNPSSVNSSFIYSLETASDVVIELWDLTGKRIRVVESGVRPAGVHVISVDTSTLPSGVVFARMTSDYFQKIRKLTIAR